VRLAVLVFCLIGITAQAQQAPKPAPPAESSSKKAPPKQMHVGRNLAYPFRHPVKTQVAIGKAVKATAKAIW